MSLIKTFNNFLDEEQEKRKERVSSGKMTPSSFGQCYRRQIYKIKKYEMSNPPDLPSIKRMMLGSVVHETIQKAFPKIEVPIETDYLKGYADIVGDDYVADIKTINPYAFKWIQKTKDIKEDKKDAWLQVATYGVLLKKKYVKLLFVNTGDFNKMEEFTFPTENWKDDVEDEIGYNKVLMVKDKLPPKEPRLYGEDKDGNPRECDYCAYKDLCKGGE